MPSPTVISVVNFVDLSDRYLFTQVTLSDTTTETSLYVSSIVSIKTITNNVTFSGSKGGPYQFSVPAGVSSFKFGLLTRDLDSVLGSSISFTISGVLSRTSVIEVSENISSIVLPSVEPAVGSATVVGDITKGVALDYSNHLDRIVTALEQISISCNTIATNATLGANNSIILANALAQLSNLSITDGHKTITPYDYLSYTSLLDLYAEEGKNLEILKSQFNQVPKGD